MRLSFLLGLYLLGQTTAAPIAAASQKGGLTHAEWANLDHRRLLSASHSNIVLPATDVDSRDTTTLLGTDFSKHHCTSPDCSSPAMASRKSVRSPTDTGNMVALFLYCALIVVVGCTFLTILLGNLYDRHEGARYPEKHHQTDVTTTKVATKRVTADEEVSDDFDDTDYPMG